MIDACAETNEDLRAEIALLKARIAELEADDTAEALRTTQQRLEYALSAAGIIAWDWDPVSGHVLHTRDVNDNLSTPVQSRTEFARMIHPDDAARTAQHFEAAFRAGTEYRQEYRILAESGVRWIMSAGRTFDGADGRRRMSGIMMDVTARHEADEQLASAGERARLAVESARIGDWVSNRVTDELELSPVAAALFGWEGPCTVNRFAMHALIHPDDAPLVANTVEPALLAHDSYTVEFRIVRPDATIWMMMAGRGRYDADGRLIGQIGLMQDISERREAAERQQMLMRELNHRVKNTLAIVQALAVQSRRGTDSPQAFVVAFEGRLRALSAAHSLLTRGSWQGAEIAAVIADALKPFDATGQRIARGGPRVRLASSVSLNLSLAVHELATNATKYGALSVEGGTVTLDWALEDGALHLAWIERGGPLVVRPRGRGFGARLIENGVTRELGGTTTLDFAPEGVACRMRLPLSEKVKPL